MSCTSCTSGDVSPMTQVKNSNQFSLTSTAWTMSTIVKENLSRWDDKGLVTVQSLVREPANQFQLEETKYFPVDCGRSPEWSFRHVLLMNKKCGHNSKWFCQTLYQCRGKSDLMSQWLSLSFIFRRIRSTVSCPTISLYNGPVVVLTVCKSSAIYMQML